MNILDFGAQRDGVTKITAAVKNAIDAAAAVGGGTIYFPAGEYLSGPIHFKSNITLYFEAGAVLRFSDDFEDYLPFVKSRWEGTVGMNFSPQFYGYRVDNIAIRGQGLIDGQGQKWWEYSNQLKNIDREGGNLPWTKYQQMHKDLNAKVKAPDTYQWRNTHFMRPPMFQTFESTNIVIEGVTLKNPPFWTLNPAFCEKITINGITITNPPESPNTDGINPSSCRFVHISNCHISAGDDCITIKSGRDVDGREWGKPCEDITITNCIMLAGHGGVVIGSEMSGDVRKITISNCVFDGTERGIRIKSMRGRGGVVEEIRVDGIVMKNIQREAFLLTTEYKEAAAESLSERTPRFRNIHLSNITATEVTRAGSLLGLDEMFIDNVTFSDINIDAKFGFDIEKSNNIEFHNVTVNAKEGAVVKVQQAENLTLDGVKTMNPLKNTPLIELENVSNAYIHNCNPLPGTDLFLSVSGKQAGEIVVGSNNFYHVKEIVRKSGDAPADAIVGQTER